MRADYKLQRLYVESVPQAGALYAPPAPQAHYLLHVLRLKAGREILLFDGKNGEWRARCAEAGRKKLLLEITEQTRPQPPAPPALALCFAPLKQARQDYMAQKAAELGASFLCPVLTQHTQISKLNTERLRANCTEAAEQCGLLSVPHCAAPVPLAQMLAGWQAQWGQAARLIFCDEAQSSGAESAAAQNPLPQLLHLKESLQAEQAKSGQKPALGLLVGPEGGFSAQERKLLYAQSFVIAMPLGPRILRADTAATAALTLLQATLGDW